MTFSQNATFGFAHGQGNVNDGTSNGATITRPWNDGDEITFLMTADAINASATITVGIELYDGSSWADMYKEDGATSMTMPAQAGASADIVGAVLAGSLDLSRISASDYSLTAEPTAMRVTVTNNHASNTKCPVLYVITGPKSGPTGATVSLLSDQLAAL